jgi:hypothetical protein
MLVRVCVCGDGVRTGLVCESVSVCGVFTLTCVCECVPEWDPVCECVPEWDHCKSVSGSRVCLCVCI